MDILLSNDKTTCKHGISDLDDFLHQRLTPLIQRVRLQLIHMDNLMQIEDSTRNKIQISIYLLNTIDEHWKRLPLEYTTMSQYNQSTLCQLEHVFSDFSEKYQQLEEIQGDYFDCIFLDDTMNSLITCIEQLDDSVTDVIDKVSDIRYIMADEKFLEFNGMAHDDMDLLESAISSGATRLLTYDELPIPWRNNMYIIRGYRFLSTPSACFRSWFYLHNETGNIYTHLIGFFFFLGLGIYELVHTDLVRNEVIFDWIIVGLFFLAIYKCLICSALWHTFAAINDFQLFTRAACLDYIGISALISASFMMSVYYGFYCDTFWRNIYLTTSGSLAIIGITMPLMPWFDRPETQWIKVVFFVTLASSGFIPIFHMLSICSPDQVLPWLSPVFKAIFSYVLGVIIYSNRVPERFWPGKFDYFGHSHQWWHILVCVGIWWNYVAAKNYSPNRQVFCQCSQ